MRPTLLQRQSPTVSLSPQMRQAIALLQLSNIELAAAVAEEIDRNPLLELAEPDGAIVGKERDDKACAQSEHGLALSPTALAFDRRGAAPAEPVSDPFGAIREPVSLHEHLMRQLGEAFDDPAKSLIGAYLIGNLDDSGYLRTTTEEAAAELSCEADRVAAVLEQMTRLDPPGVFARDLAECLALQLRERNRLDPAMARLIDNLDLLAEAERAKLRRICRVDDDDLDDMIAEIRSLDPKPGLSFSTHSAPTLVPDVIVRPAEDGGWQVELNAGTLPKLVINSAYRAHISGRGEKHEQRYLSDCFASASWLIKALHQRAETMIKVASEIVRCQERFLLDGVSGLRPLVLREVAAAVGLHESTVSRATSNKYLGTPRGTFELKYFFSSSIAGADGGAALSGTFVRHRIEELIAGEDPAHVLSDEGIAEILGAEGISVARRTVAKYREGLGLGSSAARRRAHRMR